MNQPSEIDNDLFDYYQGFRKPSGNDELQLASAYCSFHVSENKQTRKIISKLSTTSQRILATHYGDVPNNTRQCFKLSKGAGAAYLTNLPIDPIYKKLFINLLADYYLFNTDYPEYQTNDPEDQITTANSIPMGKALQLKEKQLIFAQLNMIYPGFKANQVGKLIDDIKDQMKTIIKPALDEYEETK